MTAVTDEVMSRDQVAAHLGISPESVRSWARRWGVRYGYSRADVEAAVARRTGQGARTDLQRDQPAAIHHQPDKDQP